MMDTIEQSGSPYDEDSDYDFQIKMATLQSAASGSGSFEDCDIDDYDEHGTISNNKNNNNASSNMVMRKTLWDKISYDTPTKPKHNHHPYDERPHLPAALDGIWNHHTNGGSNQQKRKIRFNKRQLQCLMVTFFMTLLVGWIMAVTKTKRYKQKQISTMIESLQDVTPVETFEDHQSPQYRALEWVLFHDTYSKHMKKKMMDRLRDDENDGYGDDEDFDAFVQRYIVAVFGYAVLPDSLHDKFQFFTGKEECTWKSKEEQQGDDANTTMGIICNDENKVEHIVFRWAGLMGELPPELTHLKHLNTLTLDGNNLVGTIPPFPNIRDSLNLSNNKFNGKLWDDDDVLYFSEDIEELLLSNNMIHGPIPAQFKYLTSLTNLALDGNELSDGINNIMGLYHLEKLQLQNNHLQDTLSNGSFQELVHLKVLNVNTNQLEGPLPDALFTACPALEYINFHTNDLSGRLLNVQPERSALKYLNAGENFLSGGISENFDFLTQLTHLDLSWNRFDEPLPTTKGFMQSLTNLTTLLLTDNDMLGPQPIPTFLQGMTSLKELSLRGTDRTGTIPDWFGSLKDLEVLDLDWNNLSGEIPPNLANMTSMKYLLLNRNSLIGTIPEDLVYLPELKMLMLDKNRLVGTLDTCNTTNQIQHLITDCGDPDQGCPDCPSSPAQEVNCPCCTHCCFDADDYCNNNDWISEILAASFDDFA